MYSEVVVILVCIPKVWDVALGHLSQRGHFGVFGVHFTEFLCPKCPYVSNFVSQLSDLCPKMSFLCSGCQVHDIH